MADMKLPTVKLPVNSAAEKSHAVTMRVDWKGLDRRAVIDTGSMIDVENVSISGLPYLSTAPQSTLTSSGYTYPISIHAFADILLIVYRSGTTLYLRYIRGGNSYTTTLKSGVTSAEDSIPRSIVQFQVFTDITDPLYGTYVSKLLIFPDKKSFDFDITSNNFPLSNLDAPSYPIPNIRYPVIFQSRLFGVDDIRIFASGFNDYTFWDLDTASTISEAGNAWVSTSQSNYKAKGQFTGITAYGGHVVCFKKDFIQQIYNTKNPFRVVDVDAEGAIDNRGIIELQGSLFYVSEYNVKYYTGGMPHNIADQLNIEKYTTGILGAYKDTLYMYLPDNGRYRIFTFNVTNEQWSILRVSSPVIGFAANDNGIYALHQNGEVRQYNTNTYNHDWYFETDLTINNTLETQSIEKIDMYVELFDSASKVDVYLLKDNETFNASTSYLLLTSTGKSIGRRVLRSLPHNGAYYGQRLYVKGYGKVCIRALEIRYKLESETYGEHE